MHGTVSLLNIVYVLRNHKRCPQKQVLSLIASVSTRGGTGGLALHNTSIAASRWLQFAPAEKSLVTAANAPRCRCDLAKVSSQYRRVQTYRFFGTGDESPLGLPVCRISASRARSFARRAVLLRFAIAARAFSPLTCDIRASVSARYHGSLIVKLRIGKHCLDPR